MFALIDCNSFFASCERVFDPSLRGKPVAVLSNNDGCIVARTQEVKDFGIPMGAPLFKVKDIVEKNGVKVFSSNYTLYGDMSKRVMDTIKQFCGAVEVYSVDEAFVTLHTIKTEEQRIKFCKDLQQTVYKHTGIPVCIGIGKTKVLAKAANRVAKKFNLGVHEVTDDNHEKLLKWLKVGDIWGIGRRYSEKLNRYEVKTAYQLTQKPDKWIQSQLTVVGLRLVHELRGNSCLYLEEVSEPKKNIISSRSFGKLVTEYKDLSESISFHASRAGEKLRQQGSVATGIQVFIRTNPFRDDPQYGRSETFSFDQATGNSSQLIKGAGEALRAIYKQGYKYKKAGVMVYGILPSEKAQYNLFTPDDQLKGELVCKAMDKVNNRYGKKVYYASCGVQREWSMKREMKSPHYSTSWKEMLLI